jgi:phospholipase C
LPKIEPVMTQILTSIEPLIVVMLENRSLDNMLGTLYDDGTAPGLVLPKGSRAMFDGLRPGLANPSNSSYFTGAPAQSVPVISRVQSSTVPNPDPAETFTNVTYQLFGPESPSPKPQWPMQGFVVNYAQTGASDATQIMQCHGPQQVPVLWALARNYAVSDAGASNGHVDNGVVSDPLQWDMPVIFNVLEPRGVSWAVYHDTDVVPSLTRTMFPQLWPASLDGRFRVFQEFLNDCAADRLPQYAFLEPSFLIDPDDDHPPHDINAGEAFLHQIWTAVSTSPAFTRTLLVITYDEHGGCYDHVLPPFGATPPDTAAPPGDQNFRFDRFGVRVPTVVISPWITAGTVFRSDTSVPYDHTAILATLRDWLTIPDSAMLPSGRIAAAPTLGQLLTRTEPRTDVPTISAPTAAFAATPATAVPNDLQRSLVSGTARRDGLDPASMLPQIQTRQHAMDFFRRRRAQGRL